ncbi:unnamed protein product [Paramecium sonneborni]|uniref:RING-type domain-containing protein n=1 Tax=Paramecium sonneborni TaxID=65129 RepID=A0A8S1KSH7_9CILI|nr:unnamed protein product [Paramecium sonneborni]
MRNTFAIALLLLITLEVSSLKVSINKENPSMKIAFPRTQSANTTFDIEFSNSLFEYYSVELMQISPEAADIALLYMESQPSFLEDGELIYDDMDYDSYAQKKREHFLLIPSSIGQVYITILTNVSISFDIVISGSQEKLCPKRCRDNGKCIDGICDCIKPFIGRDCSIKAMEILRNTQIGVGSSNDHDFYFFYEQDGSQKLRLEISTQDQFDSVFAYLLVPDLVYLPTSLIYTQGANITMNQPFSVMIDQKNRKKEKIDPNPDKLILFIHGNTFTIKLDDISQDDSKQNKLIIIIVSCIGGSLLLCFIGFFTRRAYLKRQRDKQTPATPNIDNDIKEKDLEVQTYKVEHKQQYDDELQIISNNQLQEGQDNCGICLESLKTTKIIRKTPCSHIFHGNCIEKWLQKNSYCPFCRFDLKVQITKKEEELIQEV